MDTHLQVAWWNSNKSSFRLELSNGFVHFVMEAVEGSLERLKVRVILDNLESCFEHKNQYYTSF